MISFKNNTQQKIIPLTLIILFIIFNSQIHPQVQPEWKIFNNSNSPLPDNDIRNISIDTFNNKWVLAGSELIKISGDDFTDFSNWTVIPDLPTSVSIIQADKNGHVWMGNGAGLIKYDGNAYTTYTSENSPLPYNFISGIAVDLNNNIWIMDGMEDFTPQIYLVEFDRDNNWFQLPGNFGFQTIGDLAAIDSSNYIWTSTEFKLTRVNTITHDVTEWNGTGLGQYVTEVKSDFKGNVWIAGGEAGWGGLVRFDGQNFTHFYFPAVSLAVDDQKNLWVGTETLVQDTLKLLTYDGTNWTEITPYNSPLPNAYRITNLEFDKKGNLWIATADSGLAVYKAGGIIIPVELNSFYCEIENNAVYLNWSTSTEKNNRGFEIQRLPFKETGSQKWSEWKSIGFVKGHGTTTFSHFYSYKDKDIPTGKYYYRLKQIDFDGKAAYSSKIEAYITAPIRFSIEQNYPNPFNPSTKIRYSIPVKQFLTLKVYDILGREAALLVNEEEQAGYYQVEFNAGNFASGIYIYKIQAGNFSDIKKMILMK
jgi:hypothetical protein